MSKPEDVPQDVWDRAQEWVQHGALDRRLIIARAIMAAKAEERREIQTAVQDMIVPADTSNSWQLGYRQCQIDAASAIRARKDQ